jgi:hypothetical protein
MSHHLFEGNAYVVGYGEGKFEAKVVVENDENARRCAYVSIFTLALAHLSEQTNGRGLTFDIISHAFNVITLPPSLGGKSEYLLTCTVIAQKKAGPPSS